MHTSDEQKRVRKQTPTRCVYVDQNCTGCKSWPCITRNTCHGERKPKKKVFRQDTNPKVSMGTKYPMQQGWWKEPSSLVQLLQSRLQQRLQPCQRYKNKGSARPHPVTPSWQDHQEWSALSKKKREVAHSTTLSVSRCKTLTGCSASQFWMRRPSCWASRVDKRPCSIFQHSSQETEVLSKSAANKNTATFWRQRMHLRAANRRGHHRTGDSSLSVALLKVEGQNGTAANKTEVDLRKGNAEFTKRKH